MPLVPVALLLCAGITAGRYAPVPLGVWVVLGLTLLMAGLISLTVWRLPGLARAVLGACVLAGGACLGMLAYHYVPDDHVVAFMPGRSAPLATLTGEVVTAPQIEQEPESSFRAYPQPPRVLFLLKADSINTNQGPTPCQGLVRVRVADPAMPLEAQPDSASQDDDEPSAASESAQAGRETSVDDLVWTLRPGQRVRIPGRLSRPSAPANPGQYDWRTSARRDGLLADLNSPAPAAVEILSPPPSGLQRILWHIRVQANQHLQADSGYTNRLLLHALVLGQRDRALNDLNDAMTRAGVVHFLSISGQNLTVLLGFLYLLLRLLQVPQRPAAVLVMMLLGMFLLVAETESPLLRASIMAAIVAIGLIAGRRASTANLLSAAAIVLLVVEPMELFRPGFQLSFGIVAGLLILYHPVRSLLFGRWLSRRGLMVFRQDRGARRWLWHTGLEWTSRAVSASVAAYLASLPLVAYHFGLLTPLAAVFTLLLAPLVSVTLVVGYLQLVLAWPVPKLAGMLASPLGLLTDWLSKLSEWMGGLPLICVDLYPVPVWAAGLVGVAILAAGYRRHLRLSRAWATVMVLAAATFVTAMTQLPAGETGKAELSVLDVGSGQCAVLRCPSGRTVILDAGTQGGFDPYERALQPFLRQMRWPMPSAAFVSHPHVDHYNALPGLLAQHNLSQTFVNDTFETADPREAGPARLVREFAAAGTRVRVLTRGQTVQLDDQTRVTVLWPPPASQGYQLADPNDTSLVLRVDCAGLRLLLPGDIGELAQRRLLELSQDELRAEVLILPHHGRYDLSLPELLAAVDPKIVIRSSVARRGSAAEKIPALTVHRRFLSTNSDGCITVSLDPGNLQAVGWREP